MNELISSDEDTSCFNNFQGGSSQAYAISADNANFWLATASNSVYTVVKCGDSPSVLAASFCGDQTIACLTSPVSYYTPTSIPTTPTVGDDKSLSISGEGTFVLGLPGLNEVYISTPSSKTPPPLVLQKTADPQQQFGRCVAITASGGLLAVGAPMFDNGATNITGRVYIYEKDSTTNQWNEKNPLKPLKIGIEEVHEFGKKISFSDDDKLLAVVSNEMIFFFQNDKTSRTLVPLHQEEALLFNSGPWTEFGSINDVANFDGGVAVISNDNDDSIYTVYVKDDLDNIIALDVSFNGSHSISQLDVGVLIFMLFQHP